MADEAVPHHGLEGLRQRGDPVRIDRGNQDHHIAVLGGVAAISTHDPEHFRRTGLGKIDRLDDIRADIALGIAATDGIDQSFSLSWLISSHPAKTVSQPSSLVRAVSSETLSTGL